MLTIESLSSDKSYSIKQFKTQKKVSLPSSCWRFCEAEMSCPHLVHRLTPPRTHNWQWSLQFLCLLTVLRFGSAQIGQDFRSSAFFEVASIIASFLFDWEIPFLNPHYHLRGMIAWVFLWATFSTQLTGVPGLELLFLFTNCKNCSSLILWGRLMWQSRRRYLDQ